MNEFYQGAIVNYPELEPDAFADLLTRLDRENEAALMARVEGEANKGPVLTQAEHDHLLHLMHELSHPGDHVLPDNGRYRAVYDYLIQLGFKLPQSRLIAWRKAYTLLWRGYYGQPIPERTEVEQAQVQQRIAALAKELETVT